MRRPAYLIAAVISVSATAFALPPGSKLRQGANHHLGDDSFIARFGRPPRAGDPEGVRMTTHLQHVHDWLAGRPATRPELADKRAAILAALQRYIAKGTTPRNTDLPWRTPVFIDSAGTICAVGYLIESSVGHALPEKIAKAHRYDFIEDIARAMPEVQEWIADSGLTLEEIQSIQPAYEEPQVREWRSWDLATYKPVDGPSTRYGTGNFRRGDMDGEWQVFADATGNDHQRASAQATDGQGAAAPRVVVGHGVMHHGRGAWTSFYATGEKLAEGRYDRNQPEGRWRIYHRDGNLAAEGRFAQGTRVGGWLFYDDTEAHTVIAAGRFAADGSVTGTWRHFDGDGQLLARSWTETPAQWRDANLDMNGGEGSVLDVVPGADGVHHVIHQGTPGQDVEYDELSLELFAKGHDMLYISRALGAETWYDATGAKLVHDGGRWSASDCGWSAVRRRIAAQGDVARLDGVLSNAAIHREREATQTADQRPGDPGVACHGPRVAVSDARARALDVLLASRDQIRSAMPQAVRDLILDQEEDIAQADDVAAAPELQASQKRERLERVDLPHLLAGHMTMFIEWPHIDRRFKQVYETMAGRFSAHWSGYVATDRDPNGEQR
jgi:hypothetical protein